MLAAASFDMLVLEEGRVESYVSFLASKTGRPVLRNLQACSISASAAHAYDQIGPGRQPHRRQMPQEDRARRSKSNRGNFVMLMSGHPDHDRPVTPLMTGRCALPIGCCSCRQYQRDRERRSLPNKVDVLLE